jgi:hypothetical protein
MTIINVSLPTIGRDLHKGDAVMAIVKVGTREEWLAARAELLEREKEHTRTVGSVWGVRRNATGQLHRFRTSPSRVHRRVGVWLEHELSAVRLIGLL